jgi:hypothetical protein
MAGIGLRRLGALKPLSSYTMMFGNTEARPNVLAEMLESYERFFSLKCFTVVPFER